jgi:hypothetical protein
MDDEAGLYWGELAKIVLAGVSSFHRIKTFVQKPLASETMTLLIKISTERSEVTYIPT